MPSLHCATKSARPSKRQTPSPKLPIGTRSLTSWSRTKIPPRGEYRMADGVFSNPADAIRSTEGSINLSAAVTMSSSGVSTMSSNSFDTTSATSEEAVMNRIGGPLGPKPRWARLKASAVTVPRYETGMWKSWCSPFDQESDSEKGEMFSSGLPFASCSEWGPSILCSSILAIILVKPESVSADSWKEDPTAMS